MKLLINGVEHDANEQIEIFGQGYGFNVIIESVSPTCPYGKKFGFANVTHFHHLYDGETTGLDSEIHLHYWELTPEDFTEIVSISVEPAKYRYSGFDNVNASFMRSLITNS